MHTHARIHIHKHIHLISSTHACRNGTCMHVGRAFHFLVCSYCTCAPTPAPTNTAYERARRGPWQDFQVQARHSVRCLRMRMYVCMHVCMYVCMYVYLYVCMYVCIFICMYVCMFVCMFVCKVDRRVHPRTRAHARTHTLTERERDTHSRAQQRVLRAAWLHHRARPRTSTQIETERESAAHYHEAPIM